MLRSDHPRSLGRRAVAQFVVIGLGLVLMAVDCDVEENPDAEQVSATLEDCIVEEIDADSGVEACTISSDDPRVDGSWVFGFRSERDDDRVLYQGEISIMTSSGGWNGTGERVVLDSGGWKGSGNTNGVGDYQGFTMVFGGQEESFDGTYPLAGEIAPTD